MKIIYLFAVIVLMASCGTRKIEIANFTTTKAGVHAANELYTFLDEMYANVTFKKVGKSSKANIQLILAEQAKNLSLGNLPTTKESFSLIHKNGILYIVAADDRGLLNAVYALLEKLGCGFYISNDVIPINQEWTGTETWEMNNKPLVEERFLLNWHNFLSGCTGWNLENWQNWIDQANKMKYNGIMVHAYGNNPMFSFEYLGEKKQTGYLNNTASGRDWGNQHVNDVRRMTGGAIFDQAIFGAEASKVPEEEKENAATKLMQQVFNYAEEREIKVIFALDFDTWMANPPNIIGKLPDEAVFVMDGGHITPNPDHPEGYKYYKAVVKALIQMYPQIDQLAVWHRRPSVKVAWGSIWMDFPFKKFPDEWKREYKQKLQENPGIEDNVIASGTFAYGKLIKAIQKARDEIKPELEISSGSWGFGYIPYAHAMYPADVALLPLDWGQNFDKETVIHQLSSAGKNREINPVIWAHHDDHRYIGKPYTPWDSLYSRLKRTNASGFGIIHWTTRPLDLYFTNCAHQTWSATKNESIQKTIQQYVTKNYGENTELNNYFTEWAVNGPMFGRETSNHFVDLGKQNVGRYLGSWADLEEDAIKRLQTLEDIPLTKEYNSLKYQKEMEEFYISFFKNKQLFDKAYQLASEANYRKAIDVIERANPDSTILKYIDAIAHLGFTRGEKALVFSMNTRWKIDFINLKQRLGIEPVRYKFSPTQHDPLAQFPGEYTYFINENGEWYRCMWKNELKDQTFVNNENDSYLLVNDNFNFPIQSIHGQTIPEKYKLELKYNFEGNTAVAILQDGKKLNIGKKNEINVSCSNSTLEIHSKDSDFKLYEIIIKPNQ